MVRTYYSDPQELLCSMEGVDFDQFEYCLVLTHDLALNPQKGPRIFSFNTADPDKFRLYEQKRDELFAKKKVKRNKAKKAKKNAGAKNKRNSP